MRRVWACALMTGLGAGVASAQPSPLPPPLPTAPATPAAPGGPPTTAGVPFDPAKVRWPAEVGGKPIEAYVADLKSPDPTTQQTALQAIQYFGPEAARRAAMHSVIPMVEDKDPGVRTNAVLLIGTVGFDNVKDFDAAVAKLGGLMGSRTVPGSVLRYHAARALANLGPDAHAAVPALCGAADDPSWEVRGAVADALGRVGTAVYEEVTVLDGPVAVKVPKLKRAASRSAMEKVNFVLLKDASATVRMESCQALITLGPPQVTDPAQYQAACQPFINSIASRLKAEKEPVVKVWLNLLHMMYDERVFKPTLDVLIADVNSKDVPLRLQALAAVSVLGPKGLPALNAVAGALGSGNTAVQVAAIQAMLAMGESSAQTVLPELDRFVAGIPASDATQKDIRAYAEAAAKTLRKNRPDPAAMKP